MLLDRYGLAAQPFLVPLSLKPVINTLPLYAENLGRVLPNTAVFVLRAGGREERVVLRSDLRESARVEMIWEGE